MSSLLNLKKMELKKTAEEIMADIAKVKEMRKFQKQFFDQSRKGWPSTEAKNKAVAHAKMLEAGVDEIIESYYPQTVQSAML